METKEEILKMSKAELEDLDVLKHNKIDCFNCPRVLFCRDCHGCSECLSCFACLNCHNCSFCHNCLDCSFCYGLKDAKHMIRNVQFTKEEYELKMKEFWRSG